MKKFRLRGLAVVMGALAFFLAQGWLDAAQAGSKAVYGEPKPLGQGTARSVVFLGEGGNPESIGFSLSDGALSALPAGPAPSELALELPAGTPVPPFTHLTLDWNPAGHEPPGIYDTPHFDFHFYFITPNERLKIGARDKEQFAKAPPAEFMPGDYRATPGGVPRMGAHWVDVTSPEFHGKPFTATFIYGTYDGAVVFLEPMASYGFLKSGGDFSAAIKQPGAYAAPGYHPAAYRIAHRQSEHLILLEGLARR